LAAQPFQVDALKIGTLSSDLNETTFGDLLTDQHLHANQTVLDALADAGSGNVLTSAERTKLTGLARYVVGLDLGDPFVTIQAAIDQAVTDGHNFNSPATVLVKPGNYAENITMHPGISVVATVGQKVNLTRLSGFLTIDLAGATNVTAWSGIDINYGIGAPVQFIGTNVQQFHMFNCEVTSASVNPALLATNSGTGSLVVHENVSWNNTSSGPAVLLQNGCKLNGSNSQTNAASNSGTSIDVQGTCEFDLTNHSCLGQILMIGTSGGIMKGSQIDSGSNPIITKTSTGALVIGSLYPLSGSLPVSNIAGTLIDLDSHATEGLYFVSTMGRLAAQGATGRINDTFGLIQEAITKAGLDGYGGSKPATVYILPGQYAENLTLQPGINLMGPTTRAVELTGYHTWAPVGGTLSDNTVYLENLILFASSGGPVITASGSAPCRLYPRRVNIQSTHNAYPCISVVNASAQIYEGTDSIIIHFGDNKALDLQMGTVALGGNVQFQARGNQDTVEVASGTNFSLANGRIIAAGSARALSVIGTANVSLSILESQTGDIGIVQPGGVLALGLSDASSVSGDGFDVTGTLNLLNAVLRVVAGKYNVKGIGMVTGVNYLLGGASMDVQNTISGGAGIIPVPTNNQVLVP